MTRQRVIYGDSSYTLKTVLPTGNGADEQDPTSGGILVRDKAGNDLASGNITIATATTLNGAVSSGDDEIIMTSVTGFAENDVIKIAGTKGFEFREIQGIDTSTKVVTLGEYLWESHQNTAAVTARTLTYALDASDTDTFTAGLELVVIWGVDSDGDPNFDADIAPFRDTGEVLKRVTSISNVHEKFRKTHGRYAQVIKEGDWSFYENQVWNRLRGCFLDRNRDLDNVVSRDRLEPLFFAEMKYFIATNGDSSFADHEITEATRDRDNWLDRFARAAIWEDKNQDDTEDEEEVQTAEWPLPRRRLL
jgi:hypothetical protein